MTVSATTTTNSYSGNGSLTEFNFTFEIPDEDAIKVIVRAADGTETVKARGRR